MSGNSEKLRHQSSLKFKYPRNRDDPWKSGDKWLNGKRMDDGAEGLWRVHDNLYDVTDFVNVHPGGRMWLDLTKGTDITEAFLSHHLTKTPERILEKHFVRKAESLRNSPFTFEENGFYRTLKKRIAEALKDVPKSSIKASNYMMDALFLGTIISAVLANVYCSYAVGVISGILLTCTTIAAHNYFHRKDNFRMYYFNISMMQFREWRITHALSHHLFPNTIIDAEISFLEPLLEYLPKQKSLTVRYGSWLYIVFIWTGSFYLAYISRFVRYVFLGEKCHIHWSDAVPLILPLTMSFFSEQSLLWTLWMWLFITGTGSLTFGIVAYNGAHHAPEVFHDGDTPRASHDMDWGVFQLDTICERYHINYSSFLVLTNFGDHALHHLFPTLDHGALRYLYPILNQTMDEFKVQLRMRTVLDMAKGQFMQLANDKFNPIAPQ